VFGIKTRLRDVLRRQVAVASRSQEILNEVDELRKAVHALAARVDSFVRLQSGTAELASELIGNWRRELAYYRSILEGIRDNAQLYRPILDEIRDMARLAARSYAYLGDHVGIATTAEGFRLLIDTRDRQIAPHLATVGIWEPWNTALVRAILKPGDSFVDVGSNVGFFVLLARICVGQAGRVIAFEAHPELAELLAASVEINGFTPNVDVRHLAVSDTTGELEFAGYEHYLGDGHVLALHPARHPRQATFRISCDTLDHQLPDLSGVRLLHIDAEGSEALILRGARNLIARSPRLVILMEWGLVPGSGTAQVNELDMLAEQGFSFYQVERSGALRRTSVEALSGSSLGDVLCYRGDPDEFAAESHR